MNGRRGYARRLRRWLIGWLLLILLVAWGFSPPSITQAQDVFLPLVLSPPVIQVTTFDDELNADGDCALREAIQATNSNAPVDACLADAQTVLIRLSAGEYRLTLAGSREDQNATGDLDVTGYVSIQGADLDLTLVDGGQLDRVFQIHPGSRVMLAGMTIRNGRTPNGAASDSAQGEDGDAGGGVWNGGDLLLSAVLLVANLTGNGGAGAAGDPEIGATGGNGGAGGGIYNTGALILQNSSVSNNLTGNGGANGLRACRLGKGGAGGGIANGLDGLLTIRDSTIGDNRTGVGSICVTPPTRSGGAGGDGGGLVNLGSALLERTTVVANRAANGGNTGNDQGQGGGGGRGGGLYNQGLLHLRNSTISGNLTGDGGRGARGGNGGNGGGLANQGEVRLESSTITRNVIGRGGKGVTFLGDGNNGDGGGLFDTFNSDGLTLKNTLIAGNANAEDGPDCSGGVVSAGYNLIADVDDCTITGDPTGNLLDSAPQLAVLDDYGGPTWTHALLPASAGIDAGHCTTLDNTPLAYDQRSLQRPQGSTCDIGAFEAQQ